MSGGTGLELTELIPLALVITFSPLSIIPAVLVLHTPRPRPTGLAFLAGWVIGLTALTAIFVEVSNLVGGVDKAPRWASWARVAVGAALIVFGVVRWLTRKGAHHSPAWMRKITEATPAKAGVTGALLVVVNPKVLFICAAAGLAIGTAGLGSHGSWVAVAAFVAVAAASVVIPIVAYALSGHRLDSALAKLKIWMEAHNAALVAVILVIIGLLVLYKGIHGL